MHRRPRPLLAATMTLTVPTVLALAACGGGGDAGAKDDAGNNQAATGPACASSDTTPVALAVLDYITGADPFPQRFLSAVGTDSAVPDDGFKVLQDKGPTYFYSSDPKLQAQVKEKLISAGPYTSLLVVYKGKTESDGGNTVTVSLAGHYVSGEHDGKAAAPRQVVVQCDTSGWRLPNPSKKPGSAPGAATPAGTGATP